MEDTNRTGTSEPERSGAVRRIQRLGRVTGVLYVLIVVFSALAPLSLGSFIVSGDAGATAQEILGSRWLFAGSLASWAVLVALDTAAAVAFYVLLRRVNHTLSLLTAAVRIVYSAMLGAVMLPLFDAFRLLNDPERAAGLGEQQAHAQVLSALESVSTGFETAILMFGVHVALLGYLLYRSALVPRVVGGLVAVAGIAYLADSFGKLLVAGYGGAVGAAVVTMIIVGELGMVLWLLVRGVNAERHLMTLR